MQAGLDLPTGGYTQQTLRLGNGLVGLVDCRFGLAMASLWLDGRSARASCLASRNCAAPHTREAFDVSEALEGLVDT